MKSNSLPMKNHESTIKRAINLISKSNDFHVLIVTGPAGLGKSTSVHRAFELLGVKPKNLGSYSTCLHLFNFLFENREANSYLVLDDCAGLFASELAMSILKAATWPQANGKRIVKWGSTTTKSLVDEFEFSGKLVIVTNAFPRGPHAEAVKSRSICHNIQIGFYEAKEIIRAASEDPRWFENLETAKLAADYLIARITKENLSEISLRTLRMVYEVICHEPEEWRSFLDQILGQPTSDQPLEVLKTIVNEPVSVGRQEQLFEERTGLKRRMFYYYKKRLYG